jgi:hypothetical protein
VVKKIMKIALIEDECYLIFIAGQELFVNIENLISRRYVV